MSRPFPAHPMLTGYWEPWPMEGEIHDLPIAGEIPRNLNGTLYRNGPNPQFAPRGKYRFFGGDGMVHACKLEDGRCHYRNRWVRTPKFERERAAEGEGFLLSVVYRAEMDRSELLILDAENVSGAPLATVLLPHRVPGGFHGNWRPAS